MKKVIILFVIFFVNTSWADPGLSLLSGSEWKGTCRKITNEEDKEINKQPYSRLQSTYTFDSGKLSWAVKSFKDAECKDLYEVNKSVLQCTSKPKDTYANCKQVSSENSKDEKIWKSKPMVDYAGYPNVLEIEVAAKLLKSKQLELTTIGENGEPAKETLAP